MTGTQRLLRVCLEAEKPETVSPVPGQLARELVHHAVAMPQGGRNGVALSQRFSYAQATHTPLCPHQPHSLLNQHTPHKPTSSEERAHSHCQDGQAQFYGGEETESRYPSHFCSHSTPGFTEEILTTGRDRSAHGRGHSGLNVQSECVLYIVPEWPGSQRQGCQAYW